MIPTQGYTPGHTTSPRNYDSSAAPLSVYELPVYGNRSAKFELPGSDTENTPSTGTNTTCESPATNTRSLYSNGQQYAPPVVDLSDTMGPLNPNPFLPEDEHTVTSPSQAHAVPAANLAGNNPLGPLSPLTELENIGSPDQTVSRVMSPQHSIQEHVVSPQPSQGSWGMSTQTYGHYYHESGF